MKEIKSAADSAPRGLLHAVMLLAILLAVLFWRSFLPDYVHFSNDGPYGAQAIQCAQPPETFTGVWYDTGYVGGSAGTWPMDLTILLLCLLGPLGFAKFLAPVALLVLGLCAWTFFRQLKLTRLASILGALAAMLNSCFFASACWGVASQEMALGMDFLALALIVGCRPTTPFLVRWSRLALAGLCVGMNVMEGADIGALLSMLVALFAFFHAMSESEGTAMRRAVRGVSRVAVVAVFALFIAFQTVLSLVGTSISGVAGTAQDAQAKAAHWDWATQWSLPKQETFGLLVPGLFGYKMDTPKDMQPALQDTYRNGVYWGGVGRDPAIDRFFDSGAQGTPPGGFMRFTGGGDYCGILVLLVAGWAIAQSFRRKNSVFPDARRRMIQFWAVFMLFCILFAWGRFAPFYALLYHLPYFSTIRNPVKFTIFFSWALAIVFACGADALSRLYLNGAAMKAAGLNAQFKNWWSRVSDFDRKWTFVSLGLFGASVVGWLIYAAQKPSLMLYLQKVGFGGTDPAVPNSAAAIAAFSLGQVGWWLVIFAVAVALLLVVISGYFNGPRANIGALMLGGLLIFDLGRANLPWIIHWDYKQKYEVGSLNPIVEFLRNKPYEHRVAGLPFHPPQGLELFDDLYKIEWVQHLFLYYNVQFLDIIQMSRAREDFSAYKEALAPHGDSATAPLLAREWQLTNTRYLLGPAGFLDVMNEQLDPGLHRFRIVQRFEVLPKPGIANPSRLEELTAVPDANGRYALIEFTGALPRAKLYSNWLVNTNDQANLKKLADLSFDPARTVLVSTPEPGLPAAGTNDASGTVEYRSYRPKHIVLATQSPTTDVLLLNDQFDPNWSVTVDGHPAPLLRCNFLMRGVMVPAGSHEVRFDFSLPHKVMYVTLAAIGLGLAGCAFLYYSMRRDPDPAVQS